MSIIKGQNLRLFVDEKCVAAALNATIHATATTEDVSTKDSTGDWAENEVTGYSWDASSEALVVDKNDDANTLQSLWDAYVAKRTVDISVCVTHGTKNREPKTDVFYGRAIITDMNIQSQNKNNVTLSVQLSGTGKLDTEYQPSDEPVLVDTFSVECNKGSTEIPYLGKVYNGMYDATKIVQGDIVVASEMCVLFESVDPISATPLSDSLEEAKENPIPFTPVGVIGAQSQGAVITLKVYRYL